MFHLLEAESAVAYRQKLTSNDKEFLLYNKASSSFCPSFLFFPLCFKFLFLFFFLIKGN